MFSNTSYAQSNREEKRTKQRKQNEPTKHNYRSSWGMLQEITFAKLEKTEEKEKTEVEVTKPNVKLSNSGTIYDH